MCTLKVIKISGRIGYFCVLVASNQGMKKLNRVKLGGNDFFCEKGSKECKVFFSIEISFNKKQKKFVKFIDRQ